MFKLIVWWFFVGVQWCLPVVKREEKKSFTKVCLPATYSSFFFFTRKFFFLYFFFLLLLTLTISQTQHEGTKKFSLDVPCPSPSSESSFFLMYFCLHLLTKPNGREIWLEHGSFAFLHMHMHMLFFVVRRSFVRCCCWFFRSRTGRGGSPWGRNLCGWESAKMQTWEKKREKETKLSTVRLKAKRKRSDNSSNYYWY